MNLPYPLRSLALPPLLRRFVQLLAALTLLCAVTELFCASVLHLYARYAYSMLDEYFPDFRYFADRFASLHTLEFFTKTPGHPFMYPAPAALPYAFFFLTSPQHALRYFLLVMVGSFLLAAVLLARALARRGLSLRGASAFSAATLLLSYPFWFVYHQGNMEWFVWLVLSLGLWSFFRNRPYVAAICIGIAGSIKIFPFLYLGLLLSRRRYLPIAVSLLFAVALTLVSLWIVYPDLRVSWTYIQAGVDNFRQVFMLHLREERGFDHSLFGLYKNLAPHLPTPDRLARILSLYLLVAATAGIALYVLRIRKLPVINQLLALTVASILLPPTSFDYTLVHLYAPWVLLLFYLLHRYRQDPSLRSASPALAPTLLCFAVLFAPLTEFIVHGETIGGPIRAVALVLLFTLALVYPFPDAALDQASTAPRAAGPLHTSETDLTHGGTGHLSLR